ncbi:hypothetical protein WAF17_05935 [Bernardetia sp. ABR2-2B]|uniref:DUF7638 domain-containing protein n=1 Tax=Bernardetia sp. ABR2-2B TaxID=3127472 RepID=UPI0030CE63C8
MKLNPFRKNRKNKIDFNLPKVYRTKTIRGVSMPGIIRNGTHFFVDLEVYEDGRVECWNFEDFEHFKKDVKRGWVSVSIPNRENISIHGLGSWSINDGIWIHNKESFIDYVWSVIKYLNPNLDNLYSYSEKRENNIIIGESGKGKIYKENKRIPDDPFPKKVIGKGANLFLKDKEDKYHLIRLDIYNEESIIVSRLEKSFEITLAQLEQMILEGKLLSELPNGVQVNILGLGNFKVEEKQYATRISEKLLEIKDTIRKLEGKPSTIETCIKIHQQYTANPTNDLREQLKEAYENIPEHERAYVGDMDVKDTIIRMIIYGEQEIENWSHYQLAKRMGEELPSISIPKPKND